MRSNVIQLVILNKIRHTIGESLCWLPKCRGDYHSTQLYHQGVTLLVTEKWGDYQLNYKTVLNSWALRESVMRHGLLETCYFMFNHISSTYELCYLYERC